MAVTITDRLNRLIDMHKMIMLVYNEAIEAEVMEALGTLGIKNYTKISGAFGKGRSSGTHLGTDVWPGRNNILYIACSQDESQKILNSVRELRQSLSPEGLKAFCLPVEEIT